MGRLLLKLGLLALVAGGLAGCRDAAPQAPLHGWNVLLVNVDTLRADHLGLHGYPRPTSPFLDDLAEQAVVFDDAVSNSSFTRESVAALFTGTLPSTSGAAGWRATPPEGSLHLAELFAQGGYRTGFLSNTVMLRHPGFTRGFESIQHLPARWDLSGAGPRLTRVALEFVRRNDARPFLLYLHYLDPHAPYQPAERFREPLGVTSRAQPLDLYRDVEPDLKQLTEAGFGPGDPRYEDLVARYDAEIAATDAALKQLFRGLESLAVLDRTLVVITSDHGEEFLEHGWVEHGWTLYRESVHVPLIFWAPAALAPQRSSQPVSHVDVLPTLVQLLGLEAAGWGMDGQSLFQGAPPALRVLETPRPRVLELLIPRRNVSRAVSLDGWKYVVSHRWVEPHQRHGSATPRAPVDLSAPPVREELYDQRSDPGETRDRAAEEPERLARLRALLQVRTPSAASLAPAEPEDLGSEEAERLRALGYAE